MIFWQKTFLTMKKHKYKLIWWNNLRKTQKIRKFLKTTILQWRSNKFDDKFAIWEISSNRRNHPTVTQILSLNLGQNHKRDPFNKNRRVQSQSAQALKVNGRIDCSCMKWSKTVFYQEWKKLVEEAPALACNSHKTSFYI